MKKTNILVLAPHTDDGELGCGGTLAYLSQKPRTKIYYLAFYHTKELAEDAKKASGILQVHKLIFFNCRLRNFDKERQHILDKMIQWRDKTKPDIVFMPSLHDFHQDHTVIANEACRAFKTCSLLSYEMPWNSVIFRAHVFVPLEKVYINKKVRAVKAYKSQKHRPYTNEKIIRSLARVRGVQIGAEYAESFEVVKWILN